MAGAKKVPTAAATAGRLQIGHETKARVLRQVGYLVVPPELAHQAQEALTAAGINPEQEQRGGGMLIELVWQPTDRAEPRKVILHRGSPPLLASLDKALRTADPEQVLVWPYVQHADGHIGFGTFRAWRIRSYQVLGGDRGGRRADDTGGQP